ncbi:MAG: exodeoxyribonuclease VII small subunit [Candidatus Thermoplasmatota archaeon]|jgi:exodeoxyribonuclease VII small subunit|nr:exodeoxyribonuclease VII small subunit [Candidatus Poseidoniia archaeon]MEC8949131.1 exodeoxyribonuclease VII small subunit [Candidatus Thermoplasmatota archaeon]MDP6534537.1 exodeoxyribonuclease VII small subunit [Candidatus Poseidoniia archaeon]MEC9336617.1 exodeoxyribonuclease VII small subunit [Candidatus Thermoplasmatota archaeon]MEE3276541.1 exodeoxyribonuclease VII small subunit [Candidatus Thermoplasmatota archaeon]|tara:strand:- start:261 stop:476 length:216 start_codon:yes stop_codon:yes gene_type:complete
MSSNKDEELNFSQALQQLETLLAQLESGEIELEEAMELFEQGSALAERCREMLANAEQRLEELAPAEPEGE